MKRFILMICLLSCSGCCVIRAIHTYYSPSMDCSLFEESNWDLIVPPRKWVFSHQRALLPQYFTYADIDFAIPCYNYLYAKKEIDLDGEIVIFINFATSFYISKGVRGEGECATVGYGSNAESCRSGDKLHEVVLGINKVDVDFDNQSVYFILHGKRKYGTEIEETYYLRKHKKLPKAVYNLSGENSARQTGSKIVESHSHTSFFFLFEDMTCRDFENAVFVIDGFSHKGKKLPPLKIHMRYYNLDAVPEHKGDAAAQGK